MRSQIWLIARDICRTRQCRFPTLWRDKMYSEIRLITRDICRDTALPCPIFFSRTPTLFSRVPTFFRVHLN